MAALNRHAAEEVQISQSQKAVLRRSGGILIRGNATWILSDLELDKLVEAWTTTNVRAARRVRPTVEARSPHPEPDPDIGT